MATTTVFSPPREPFIGPSLAPAYATINAGFGDSYVQRAQDGVNNITHTVQLVWPKISAADAATMKAFFDSMGGWQAFLYTIPGDSVQRQWTATGVAKNDFGSYSVVQATFTEVHDV